MRCGDRLLHIERLTSVNTYSINDLDVTLQIRKHEYDSDLDFFLRNGDLDFIILFVGILPLYAINLGVVSLFADSSSTFLTMLILMYSINLNK